MNETINKYLKWSVVFVAVVLVLGAGFAYWFNARLSCAKSAQTGGSIESRIYRNALGLSNFSEEKYQGCMRSYGF